MRWTIEESEHGRRLDQLAAERVPLLSRRSLDLVFRRGQVRVNGHVAKKGERARVGSQVHMDITQALDGALPAPDVPLKLWLVTTEIIICEKPAGMPSAALPGKRVGTAAGSLLAQFPELRDVGFGPREPGLLHRLDTCTSGLLVAARTSASFEHLRGELLAGRLTKRYLAIVCGSAPDDGIVSTSLAPDPKHPARVRVGGTGDGVMRATRFKTLGRSGGYSLVEALAPRAYRHQVRAHLASIGLPLAGDAAYGGPTVDLSGRHALHASYVAGTAPGGSAFVVESPLPGDLVAFWDSLAAPGG